MLSKEKIDWEEENSILLRIELFERLSGAASLLSAICFPAGLLFLLFPNRIGQKSQSVISVSLIMLSGIFVMLENWLLDKVLIMNCYKQKFYRLEKFKQPKRITGLFKRRML